MCKTGESISKAVKPMLLSPVFSPGKGFTMFYGKSTKNWSGFNAGIVVGKSFQRKITRPDQASVYF
jgi:hypothetical protein